MKSNIFVFFAMLLIAGFSFAESKKTRCENVAQTAYYFAQERDAGVSSEEMKKRILKVKESGALTNSEFVAMSSVAWSIYTDYRKYSPDNIRRDFLKECR